jgi:hypothetical protein
MDDIIISGIISIRVGSDREGDHGIQNHTNGHYNNKYNGNASNYALILKLLRRNHYEKADLYERLLHIFCFFTDGRNALELFETINGKKRIN